MGTIQNWAPHPSTPYYPGLAVAQKNIEYDPDTANAILDSLGLTQRDAEGYRLRPDNGERLVLRAVVPPRAAELPILELTQPMWADIGIELAFRLTDHAGSDYTAGVEYLTQRTDFSAYQANPWCCNWNTLVPMTGGYPTAPKVGLYIQTKGKNGMWKGPDPSYLPLAPADTFPIDVSGNLARLIDLWQEGRSYPAYDPRRIAIGKEIFTIYGDELYSLPVAGFTGISRGIFINRNNMRNQPVTHIRDHNGFTAWAYYFDGGTAESRGKDNYSHSGNRSVFKSFSFLGGG
jgi:peptide/nickel transport system substrate-binding protein